MTGEVGPMNLIPSAASSFGRFGFSLAWPQPDHTASTPVEKDRATLDGRYPGRKHHNEPQLTLFLSYLCNYCDVGIVVEILT